MVPVMVRQHVTLVLLGNRASPHRHTRTRIACAKRESRSSVRARHTTLGTRVASYESIVTSMRGLGLLLLPQVEYLCNACRARRTGALASHAEHPRLLPARLRLSA